MESVQLCKRRVSYPLRQQWRDLETVMLSEISQLEKDKYHLISRISEI